MGTIVVSIILIAIVTARLINMIKNKKKGMSILSCSCGCSNCPSASMCHGRQEI